MWCHHPDQAGDRQQVAGGIEGERQGGAGGRQQQAADRRSHQLAHVEDHREAGQVGPQLVGFIHQQGHVLVAGRELVGAGHADAQGAEQQQHVLLGPVADRDGQGPEGRGGEQPPLGADQHLLAAGPVGEHARRTAHHQRGQGEQGEVQGQQQRVARPLQQQPALGGEPGERAGRAQPRGQQEGGALVAGEGVPQVAQAPPEGPARTLTGAGGLAQAPARRAARASPTIAFAPTTSPTRS